MKFSVGDKIKLRKTGEEGVVVDIVQNQYLRVRINDVVIPAEETDLDFPYLDWFIKDREEKKALEHKRLKGKTVYIDNIKKDRSEYSTQSRYEEGLYILIQPVYREQDDQDVVHRFVVYLYSEWPRDIDYVVNISIQGKSIFSFEGVLDFQQQQLLYSFSFEDASDNPVFEFEIKERGLKITPTHFFCQKLARKQLIKSVQQLQEENLALFEIAVFTQKEFSKKLEKPVMNKMQSSVTVLGTPRSVGKSKPEIDLHIEKICKQHAQLSDGEKLHFQLDYFNKYLDLAIADTSVNPLRVIHGIGNGVLKKRIFSICKQTKQVQDFGYDKLNPGVSLIYFAL